MIVLMSEHTFLRGPKNWWRQAVVYQIYPRSFADANGDGIGDLKGIISRVDYLKQLGVDAVWLSPHYPSELADGGYDVADYRDVDPRIGTLAEFDEMVEKLHAAGIRIFVDIVPNHSSDQHVWFQEALKAKPGSPERDRYIFRDGKGENGEIRPSELISHFGPTGWTRITEPDGTPGQWYLHLFAKEQPDFNWDNPEVREDFLKTIKFWSDRGVDGYRIDVAHALTKNLKDGNLPARNSFGLEVMRNDGTDDLFDRNEVHEIYKTWRKVFNEYDPPRVAVAEAWVHPNRRAAYASEEGLGQAFGFDLLGTPWNRKKFQDTIDFQLKEANSFGSSTTWVFSNHDVVRHATRFGLDKKSLENLPKWFRSEDRESKINFELGSQRAKAATMLVLALPGSTYLYQGEELGLHEPLNIPSEQMQDPQWFRAEGSISRDGCRVPMPWTSEGPSYGFGSGGSHLPQPDWFKNENVEVQNRNEGSSLNLYRLALALRKQLQTEESLTWIKHFGGKVLHFRRPNGWECFTNFGSKPVKAPTGRVILSTNKLVGGKVPANTTVWLQR